MNSKQMQSALIQEKTSGAWEAILAVYACLKKSDSTALISLSGGVDTDGEYSRVEITRNRIAPDATLILDFEGHITANHAYTSCNSKPLLLHCLHPFHVEPINGQESIGVSEAEIAELVTYLPYAILPFFAKRDHKCFAISHFAQTLDGRIASSSGDSQWIGNSENLIHAHKMRALCDAILIGANTQRLDQPSLTVRHVTGIDPVRVILGGCESSVITGHSDQQIHLTRKKINELGSQQNSNGEDSNSCLDVLDYLYQQNIVSVYVEGGAATTSRFVKQKALDQVQVHISPKVLGSGQTGFDFQGVSTMQTALQFQQPRFISMGNHVMFVGETRPGLDTKA